jgi:two-component system NtrC family sensor kinase
MAAVQTTALSTYRVLIVDDNEGIHQDFRTLLQPRREPDELDELAVELFGDQAVPDEPIADLPSYRCDSVFQGDTALENVKDAVANGESYALAFIDIRMPPGWDGVETILHIWEIDPNIQMVLCSAYSDYSWEEIVQKLGVSDKLLLLRKPFDPNSVKQLTLATTSRWHHERLARQRLHEIEQRLDRCRGQLVALEAGISRSSQALEETADVQATLDDLTQALDRLAAASLRPEQGELVAHARKAAATLQAALRAVPRSGGAS